MAKKLFLTLSIIAFFASCGGRNTATSDRGVVINGVRWATRNVDVPGTFAENPEDFGMLFQWNRRKGWNSIDRSAEGWDSFCIPEGVGWKIENDPCPEGWRVPTNDELKSLQRVVSISINRNGVNGRLFGIPPNQIFLPYAGWRSSFSGAFLDASRRGSYWSSTQYCTEGAWGAILLYGIIISNHARGHGNSVRCVAK